MKKSEKLQIIKGWMDSEDLLEAINDGGDDFLIQKMLDELEIGTEKTAKNYLAEIRNPKAEKPKAKSFKASVAKGYDSPLKDKWEELVDANSKAYAFLEVEQREFDQSTGKKLSSPRVISLNEHDAIQFKGKQVEKKDAQGKMHKVWAINSQKMAQGLSINAVLHVPTKFGVSFTVDEWE